MFFEGLEPRLALATIFVTRMDDAVGTGDGVTLREAILAANTNASVDGSAAGQPGNDAIDFALGPPGTIMLGAGGQLTISEPLFIRGNGSSATIIDAHGASRVFDIASTAGDVILLSLAITNGSVVDATGGNILSDSTGTLSILNSVVSQGLVLGIDPRGGGVFASGPVVVSNALITSNTASGSNSAFGGGLFSTGPVTITSSAILGNTAQSLADAFGGGVDSFATITVNDSTIANNSAVAGSSRNAGGGGVFGVVTIIGSTVSTNSAFANGGTAEGGGVYGFPLVVEQSTVAFNSVAGTTSRGGGLFTTGGLPGTIRDSIVAGNTDNDGGHPDLRIGNNTSTLAVVQTSLIGDNNGTSLAPSATPSGEGNIVGTSTAKIDPQLRPLAFYGGRTPTHALLPGSPARSHGKINHSAALGATPGLRALYRLNETSGTTAADSSGGGFNGTYTNGVTLGTVNSLVTGDGGNTMQRVATFDGSNDQVTLPTAVVPAGGFTDFSLSFWVNSTQPSASGIHWYTGKGLVDGQAGSAPFSDFGTSQLNGKFAFGVGNPDTTVQSAQTINDGQWHHVVATRVSSTGAMAVYVDGFLSGTATGPTGARAETTRLVAGSLQLNTNFFAGQLDEVAIFTRALEAGEVASLYRAEVPLDNDQRGAPFSRVVGNRDYGAYELQVMGQLSVVVSTAVDENDGNFGPGDLSLREAIGLANDAQGMDQIRFSPALNGQPILLTQGQLEIADPLMILGNGATNTIIDAQQHSRAFNILSSGGDVTFEDVTVRNGKTTADDFFEGGGGIRSASQGTLTIQSSTLTNNTILGTNAGGGAVFAEGKVTITNATVNNNRADRTGGGIHARGSVTVIGSTISQNSAGADAGGIYANGAALTVVNSTISGNTTTASDGGGLFGFTVNVISSTISDNTAADDGGGIFAADALKILNSIVAGNRNFGDRGSPDFAAFFPLSGVNVTSSLIGDNSGTGLTAAPADVFPHPNGNIIGTHAAPIDPQLGPLADNGGPTQTHALLPGSPAIDAGSNALAKTAGPDGVLGNGDDEPLTTDQRGAPFRRIVNAAVDMGAYEVHPSTLVVTTNADELDPIYDAADLSLREALALANADPASNTITFGPMTSGQPIMLSLGQLEISNSVTIRGNGTDNTIIAAQQQSRVFDISSTGGNVVFEGLAIGGGTINADGDNGGGIRSQSAGILEIRNSVIAANSANGIDAKGGGIYSAGNLVITGSTIVQNSTLGQGGGIFADASLTINNSAISENIATLTGGGIRAEGGANITGSTISDNRSDFGGGGIYVNGDTLKVTSSAIILNQTAGDGGGMFAFDVTLINSTISGNRATGDGGGIWLTFGSVRNSTIARNEALNDGGGLFGIEFLILNSIVAQNSDTDGSAPDIRAILGTSAKFSLIGDNSDARLAPAPDDGNLIGTNVVPIDPRLGLLGENGGPTQTLALLTDSPAIDAGNSLIAIDPSTLQPLLSDQRGSPFVRIADGPDANATSTVDMGAFEFHSLVVTTSVDELDPTFDAADLSLREAIALANANLQPETITFAPALKGRIIFLTLGQLEITDSLTISGNGAALTIIDAQQSSRVFEITSTAGDVTLDGVTVASGLTTGSEDHGGGIRSLSTGTLTIRGSLLTGNTTTGASAGGAIYAEGKLFVTSSTISGNEAGQSGGGIAAGSVIVTNSTISGNHATGGNGGGIFGTGSVAVTNSTISGNTATGDGGGFLAGLFSSSSLAVLNSIIAGNTDTGDGSNPDFRQIFGVTTLQFSLIGDNSGTGLVASATPDFFHNIIGGAGAAKIDPKLGPLADNGGPTLTRALLPGSPAIDAGNSFVVVDPIAPIPFDQRGAPFVRIADGPDADTLSGVDMGAYEAQAISLVVTTADDELDSIYDAADLSLREALALTNANPGADTITFDPNLTEQVISLNLGELVVSNSVTISGPGALHLDISGAQQSRVFRFGGEGANTYNLSGVSVRDGNAVSSVNNGVGGGILMADADDRLSITSSMIWFNTATFGGGISVFSGELGMTNVMVMENTATQVGGVQLENAQAVLANVTVSSNTASSFVGGIGNFASGDGASSGLRLINSTVVNNQSPVRGAGIDNSTFGVTARATVAIGNSIVANNPAGLGAQFRNFGFEAVILSFGNNISSDASGSLLRPGDKENTNPMIGGLGNKGGDVLTHSLLPGSPAIDAGSNGTATIPVPSGNFEPLTTDGRGAPFSRIVNGTVDIGAYEVHPTTLVVTTNADELDPIYNDADLSLREAIAFSSANPGIETITFAQGLTGQTITLTLGELQVASSVTIQGAGADKLSISGGSGATQSRVFNFGGGGANTYTVSGLTVRDGNGVGSGFTGTGGAILLLDQDDQDDRLVITDSVVRDSHLAPADTSGGGITAVFGTLELTNVTIMNNSAAGGGGLIVVNVAATLTNVTVSGNKANEVDGGILISGGSGFASPTSLRLINSTVAANESPLAAGIFEIGEEASAALTLGNSIVAKNTGGGTQFATSGAGTVIVSLGNNLSSDASGSLTNTGDKQNIDPLLGLLANNGSPMPTHAVPFGSPAHNAGSNALAKTAGPDGIFGNGDDVPLMFDQRGAPRVFPGGAVVDIGAFEFVPNQAPGFFRGLDILATDEDGANSFAGWATFIRPGLLIELGQAVTFDVSVPAAQQGLFKVLPAINAMGTLTFTPQPNAKGAATVTVVLRDNGGTADGGVNASQPQTFTISIAKPHPWHNSNTATFGNLDVNGKDGITVLDAVMVINYLNSAPPAGPGSVPASAFAAPPGVPSVGYIDVAINGLNGNLISVLDALQIINFLNTPGGEGEGGTVGRPATTEGISELAESRSDDGFGDIIALLAIDAAELAVRKRRAR